MKMPNPKMLMWWLSRLPAQAGLLGIIGLVLLVLAVLMYYQKQKPLERDLDKREIELVEKEKTLEVRAKEIADVPVSSSAVRAEETFTTFLREGVRLAQANNLKGSQIEYRTLSEAGGRLVRYGMQFPVNGTYPDLRNFVIQIDEIPGVRVENMVFSRSQISDMDVSAQIQLSYLTSVKRP